MRKLCPSGYVARVSRRQNTGHIPGKKCAANKRVYTVDVEEKGRQDKSLWDAVLEAS